MNILTRSLSRSNLKNPLYIAYSYSLCFSCNSFT